MPVVDKLPKEAVERDLLLLCEKQLKSALWDFEAFIRQVTEGLMASLHSTAQGPAPSEDGQRALLDKINTDLRHILVKTQFFDEYHQRVDHVAELIGLLNESCSSAGRRREEGGNEISEDDLEGALMRIFSTRREVEVIRELFPHMKTDEGKEKIELF